MNGKFLIVFFFMLFHIGVTYASPLNEHTSEGIHPEEKPLRNSSVTTDHINQKVEPTPVATAVHVIPITQNSSVFINHSEIPTVEISTTPDFNHKISQSHSFDAKNVTQDSSSKNTSSVINNKSVTAVTNGKNISQPIENKSISAGNGTKNLTVSVDIPAGTNPSTLLKPLVLNASISTSGNFSISTTTMVNPTASAEGNFAPVTPNLTSISKVIEPNTPAPVQEKHFDGPSFIGGIVLTIGLTAIGFISFKYYKAGKIDMNYRTL